MNKKSILAAFILTFLFGPLGLFYSSIIGGLVTTFLALIGVLIAPPLLMAMWVISIVWGIFAVVSHNEEVNIAQREKQDEQQEHQQQVEADDEWATLVKYDATVKAAVEKVQQYGDSAVAELRKAYTVVKDKEQLPRIAEQIASEHA